MPVVAVNLALKTYEEVQSLVSKGAYGSLEQFIEVALLSQLALERGAAPEELTPTRAPVVAGGAQRSTASAPRRVQAPVARRTLASVKVGEPVAPRDWLGLSALGTTPALLDQFQRPASEHVWGQVNRILPLKFAVRWLAVDASKRGEWATLATIADQLCDDASALGSVLEQLDLRERHGRDDALSTAFPRKGNAASRDRYLSQFIARTTRSGEIFEGALSHYGLAGFQRDRIALTPFGLNLATLPNPIIDEQRTQPPTLSDDEVELVLSGILKFLPGEANDIAVLAMSIAGGNNTPEALLLDVRASLPQSWTAVMVRTHISGVLARAVELHALRRRWAGRHVTYELTERGRDFLASFSAHALSSEPPPAADNPVRDDTDA